MPDELRVAVLLDSQFVDEWQRQALERLVQDTELNASITTIIVNQASSPSSFRSQLRSLVCDFTLYKGLIATRKLSRTVSGQPWYRERTHLSDVAFLSDHETIECVPQPADGIGNELPAEAVAALSETDIAVRFGFGIVKGAALSAPRHGVLSYHHGDLRRYRGRPAGFYEFLQEESEAGVTIQKLNETLDGGAIVVLTHVDAETATSWPELRSRLFSGSINLLSEAVSRCVSDGETAEAPESLGKLYTTPSNRQVLSYLAKRFRYTVRDFSSPV